MDRIIDILKKYQKEDGTIEKLLQSKKLRGISKQEVPKTVFNEKSEQLRTANVRQLTNSKC